MYAFSYKVYTDELKSPLILYQLFIAEAKCNLVSWRAHGCQRFPSDIESYPYTPCRHVTPKASCVTVNNPTIIKATQIKENPS